MKQQIDSIIDNQIDNSNQVPNYDLITRLMFSMKALFMIKNGFSSVSEYQKQYISQLDKFCDPLILKYALIIDQNLNKIVYYGLNLQKKFLKRSQRIFKLGYSGNIFNNLVSQWLIQHIHFQENICSKEFFMNFNQNLNIPQKLLDNFYYQASQNWEQLKEPSIDEIKHALLKIVANTINMNLNLKKQTFGLALYDILITYIQKQQESYLDIQYLSEQQYIKIVKAYMGVLWQDQFYVSCKEYFEFARNFVLIDFPNRNANQFERFKLYINNKAQYLIDMVLEKIEIQISIKNFNQASIFETHFYDDVSSFVMKQLDQKSITRFKICIEYYKNLSVEYVMKCVEKIKFKRAKCQFKARSFSHDFNEFFNLIEFKKYQHDPIKSLEYFYHLLILLIQNIKPYFDEKINQSQQIYKDSVAKIKNHCALIIC